MPHTGGLFQGSVSCAPTSGAVETSRTWVSTVAGDVLGAVIASRAGEAGSLARQGAVGACTTGLWKTGPSGAEVPLGTGPPMP